MLINDWDISKAGARQWNVEYASCKIDSNSDWIDGSPIPVLFRNYTSFKTLTIKLMLNGKNREELLLQRSDILAQLLEPAVIELDNYSHKFIGIMASITGPNEESLQRFHTLTFTFDCEEYGECQRYEIDGFSELDIDNPGNIITPIIVELTAEQDLDYFEIYGICRKLTVMGRGIEEERNLHESDFILANDRNKTLGTIGGAWETDDYDLVTANNENIDVIETEAIDDDPTSGVCGVGVCGYSICGNDTRIKEEYRLHALKNMFEAEHSPILSSSAEWKNNLTVSFSGLKAGQTIILNGETGIFIDQETELPPENMVIWALPTFMPGSNLVYITSLSVKVSIRFYPRYM